MPSLRDTQIAFGAAIRGGDAAALGGLIGDDGISPERRIQIYRNNYRLNALTALQATYPVVERLGGAEWFAQSAAKYQDSRPSQSGDLQYFGAAYPEFLRQDLENTDFGYFADVAALEWSYECVLTAPDGSPVNLKVLHQVAPQDYENLVFVPQPALRLVASPFPIFAIWHTNQPDGANDAVVRLDAGGSRVLVIRRPDHVELREITAANFALLRQFQRGVTLGAAAEAAAVEVSDDDEVEPFDLTTSLRALLGLGAIMRITPGAAPSIL